MTMTDGPIRAIKDEVQDLENRESKKAVKTSYSDEARYIALAAVDLNGGNVYRTAVAIGIPASTLREWNDARHARAAEFAEGRKEKRGNLRDKIESTVHSIVEGITPEKIAKATLSQSFVAIGIGWDKIHSCQDEEIEDPTAVLCRLLNLKPSQLPERLELEPGDEIPVQFFRLLQGEHPIIDTHLVQLNDQEGTEKPGKDSQPVDASATEDGSQALDVEATADERAEGSYDDPPHLVNGGKTMVVG